MTWDRGWGGTLARFQIKGMTEVRFFLGLKFSVPFSAVTLSKYSKYSFFFGVDFNLAYTDYPRHLESKVPLPSSTSKAKKLFPTASEGVYKGNIEKQGCFYRDGSIF